MKLSKLYSDKPFHNTTFLTERGGFNVIVGDAKGKSEGSNSHSLGKTKLAELIDFMMLKKHSSVFFYKSVNKNKFNGYIFYLEILLNNGQYITIIRSVDKPTKIAFELKDEASKGYMLYEYLEKDTLPLAKAQSYLNEQLDFDFCKSHNESYRRLLNYSLRTQGDYSPSRERDAIFQLSKFSRSRDEDWKPLIFSLLGFQGDILQKKYTLETAIKEGSKTIKAQEADFGIKTEDKDSLIGKIQNANLEKEKLTGEIESLNFYQQDKATIEQLVGSIEEEIADLNNTLYNLQYDIKKLEDSIRNGFSFDLEKVKKLFEEVEIHFPDQLTKSYEQLIEFNTQITQERNEQIKQTLKEKKEEELDVLKGLKKLNQKRSSFRDLIQDTSLFKKYSVYQKQLIEIEQRLIRYQTQLEAIEDIEQKKAFIEETKNNELQEVKNQIKKIVENTATCELYMNIRKSFLEITKQILNENAMIAIKPNANYNIDFKPEFPNSAKDEGNTYYKILCVAFDLAILINYRNESYFRFVYHDDIIAGDDNGVKSRLIETVKNISAEHDIQYIFSVIKDNIPPSQDLDNAIILYLHDKDDEGKLFKMSF